MKRILIVLLACIAYCYSFDFSKLDPQRYIEDCTLVKDTTNMLVQVCKVPSVVIQVYHKNQEITDVRVYVYKHATYTGIFQTCQYEMRSYFGNNIREIICQNYERYGNTIIHVGESNYGPRNLSTYMKLNK